jgi:p-hydroxybenzoate 3-monooxygenase
MIHKTQTGIVGAGPSGLLLSRLLALQGIESIVVERQSRDYVEGRIRAGVLEQGTMDLLDEAEIGARMHAEGLVHGGVELGFNGKRHPIDFVDLTGGKTVMVYGQTEVTKDLNSALAAAGAQIVYEAEAVTVDEFDSDRPFIRYRKDGEAHEIQCDFIAGCDGFHGVSRRSIPSERIQLFERVYPFSWLGILAETPPVSDDPDAPFSGSQPIRTPHPACRARFRDQFRDRRAGARGKLRWVAVRRLGAAVF